VSGGVAVGGYVAIRDKRIGSSIDDAKLDASIKARLYKVSPKLYSEVSAVTDNGCVLLTGTVSDPEWISVAERETWAVGGVLAVDNNLTHVDAISPSQMMKDGYLTSMSRAALTCAGKVRSVNYKIKTMNGVVYIRGIARTDEELQTVLEKLKEIRGVRKVVSYITVANKQ
jgi:osmotically-inducible protein OsmY